jgi:hypothetical protein
MLWQGQRQPKTESNPELKMREVHAMREARGKEDGVETLLGQVEEVKKNGPKI